MDDTLLIKRILAKDRRALYTFYQKFYPKISRYVKSKIGSACDADEVTCDCLYSFIESARDFEGRSSVNTFLFSIVRHKVIDYYRRKKVKHLVFSQTPYLENLVSPFLLPEDQLDINVLREKIFITLSKLFPKYKKVLLFKYADGRSVSEIAIILATTAKGAESVLFRARKAFVKEYAVTKV
ncbi:RNA polymerase sigma factor [Patescibacteria group bacterium]